MVRVSRQPRGQQKLAKKSQWALTPVLDDENRVGLAFISVCYGVVLVSVFPSARLASMGVAGWFHLALAAFMLVISWVGYYTNREMYPTWRVQFFNIPLWQYIISFGVLFTYWELGITIEAPGSHATPTPRPEAVIIVIAFVAYLIWDILEVRVQEGQKYVDVLKARHPSWQPAERGQYVARHERFAWIYVESRHTGPFAKDVRASLAVTIIFTCGYVAMLLTVFLGDLRGTLATVVIDGIYIVSFFAFRYFERRAINSWYVPLINLA
jgi:hypothetical protein